MKTQKLFHPYQTGFSLLELLTAVTILAIIMATVTMIISGGLRTLKRSGKTHAEFSREREIFESLIKDTSTQIDSISLDGDKLELMGKGISTSYILSTSDGKFIIKRIKDSHERVFQCADKFRKPEFAVMEGYSPTWKVLRLRFNADNPTDGEWLFLVELKS